MESDLPPLHCSCSRRRGLHSWTMPALTRSVDVCLRPRNYHRTLPHAHALARDAFATLELLFQWNFCGIPFMEMGVA